MTTTAQPRFDDLDLDGVSTVLLVELLSDLTRLRDQTSNEVVKQAYALRAYQVESEIAVRNAQVVADLDEVAEQRTVARIVEWLRDCAPGSVGAAGFARLIEDGEWRSR